jgi:hypothetical protein
MTAPTRATSSRRLRTSMGRSAFVVGVPLLVAAVISRHPPDPVAAPDLGALTDRYLWIHVALLFLLPPLGMVIWMLLDGLTGAAAGTARLLLPVALVFYAAFDALVGIGAGLLSREAMALSGAQEAGAHELAGRWMEIPFPLPIVSTVAVLSWTATLLAAALAHWRARSSWVAVAGLALAGPLFGFGHPLFAGVLGMAALAAAGAAIERNRR